MMHKDIDNSSTVIGSIMVSQRALSLLPWQDCCFYVCDQHEFQHINLLCMHYSIMPLQNQPVCQVLPSKCSYQYSYFFDEDDPYYPTGNDAYLWRIWFTVNLNQHTHNWADFNTKIDELELDKTHSMAPLAKSCMPNMSDKSKKTKKT